MAKKVTKPDIQECGCAFIIDASGVPTVECPTNEAQALAFAALQRNPDVQIRVVASMASSVIEDGDDLADSDADDDDDFEDDDLEFESDDFDDEE